MYEGVEEDDAPFGVAVAVPPYITFESRENAQECWVTLVWPLGSRIEDAEAKLLGVGAEKCVIYCGRKVSLDGRYESRADNRYFRRCGI